MDTKQENNNDLFSKIQANWKIVLMVGAILYIVVVAILSVTQQAIRPILISVSPENKSKEVRVTEDLVFEFNKNVDPNDFSVVTKSEFGNLKLETDGRKLIVKHSELKGKTIYYYELSYKGTIIFHGQFATEGTSILTIIGLKPKHETELFDVFVDNVTVVVYVRQEPYEENKVAAEEFLQKTYPNKFKDFRISWIAPLPENELTWEDLTKEVPDGAP